MSHPKNDPYAVVRTEIDTALAARDPILAEEACKRAQLALARAATSPDYDPRRHRAIAIALRDRTRIGVAAAPALTRRAKGA